MKRIRLRLLQALNDDISRFEEEGCTVVEGDRTLPISRNFLSIAEALIGEKV